METVGVGGGNGQSRSQRITGPRLERDKVRPPSRLAGANKHPPRPPSSLTSWLRYEHGPSSRLFRGSVAFGRGATAPESHRPGMSSPGVTFIIPTPHDSRGGCILGLTRVFSRENVQWSFSNTTTPSRASSSHLPRRVPRPDAFLASGPRGQGRSNPAPSRTNGNGPATPEGATGYPAPPPVAAGRGSHIRGTQGSSVLSMVVLCACT